MIVKPTFDGTDSRLSEQLAMQDFHLDRERFAVPSEVSTAYTGYRTVRKQVNEWMARSWREYLEFGEGI